MNTSKRGALNPRGAWRASRVAVLLAAAVAAAGAGGCIPNSAPTLKEAGDRRALEEQVAALQRDMASRDAMIAEQAARIRELQRIDPQSAPYIPHAERIEIEAMSGTYDDDHNGRPEGIVVYFRPLDADGDVVKAAGTATVQALDLQSPPESQVVAECSLDAAAVRKAWYGKIMTSHCTVKCSWKAGPPAHSELTLRVRFVDLVTGKPLESLRQIKVVPAASASASP